MGMAGVAAVLGVAMLVATAADCVHAAPSAQAGQAAQRSFSIAAGPLAHVIAQYANQAGVALSFDAAQLGRLQSPGLQGSYGVEDGFARLLQGTALQAGRERERTPLNFSHPVNSHSALCIKKNKRFHSAG